MNKHPVLCVGIIVCKNQFQYFLVCFSDALMINEHGGVVLERRTPNPEVLDLIPTSSTVLCP